MVSQRYFAASMWLSLASFGTTTFAKPKLNAPKSPETESNRPIDDYNSCRKVALTKIKETGSKRAAFENMALAQCRDKFPAIATFVECKKAALVKAKDSPDTLKAGLAACRKEHALRSFGPASDLPFYATNEELIFAGVGLNAPRQIAKDAIDTNFGNYDCNNLETAMAGPGAEDYLLFGNEAKVFPPFDKLSPAESKSLLELKPGPKGESEPYFDSPVLGRVFPDRKKRLVAYFPSAYCHFSKKLGPRYAGIKIYYLLDRSRKMATPFFAASFYKASEENPEIGALADKVVVALGEGYRKVQNKKGVIFVAKSALKETDSDGDPLNVCAPPREHSYLAVLKPFKDTAQAELLIVANVVNLCKHGDRLAARTLKKVGAGKPAP